MQDFGEAMCEIEPDDTITLLLPVALEKAIYKIRYILNLENG